MDLSPSSSILNAPSISSLVSTMAASALDRPGVFLARFASGSPTTFGVTRHARGHMAFYIFNSDWLAPGAV